MNVVILIILTIAAGLSIRPALRHDNELPIHTTGKACK